VARERERGGRERERERERERGGGRETHPPPIGQGPFSWGPCNYFHS